MKDLDKLSHEELLEEHQELQKRNEEMRIQLIGSEKLALLGQMLAGIIHEINTPIAAIKNNVDVFEKVVEKVRNTIAAENDVSDASSAKIEKLLGMVDQLTGVNRTACSRIHDVIQSVRTYARGDKSDPEVVSLNKLFEDSLTILRHETKGRITIHKSFPDISLTVYPGRLAQVFLNLLANACQAIDNEGDIWIEAASTDDEVKISIRDNGRGIAADRLPGLFIDGHTTRESGMGMGLIIVKKLIDLHKGRIEVASKKGEGTTFTIFLPI
ncbi:MAG: ATP-binding protein [Calditrichota bacterium]